MKSRFNVKSVSYWLCAVAMAFAFSAAAPSALAQDPAQEKQKLQERFKARDAELQQYKRDGRIGETTRGVVEAVKADDRDDAMTRFIREENADREALYQLLAKERDVPVDVVTEEAARRNFRVARAGDYLKTAGGEWRQKE